tara:strand:- start:1 stop:339 length:339 start_codon:yes stop_codon:yes gene_type:complete
MSKKCIILFEMSDKQNQKNEWAEREVGALWLKQSPNQKYFSGHVRMEDEFGEEKTLQVVIFRNKNKQKDNHPDFRIYKSVPKTTSGQRPPTQEEAEEVVSSGVQEVQEEELL